MFTKIFQAVKRVKGISFFSVKKGIVANALGWDLVHMGSTWALCWISYQTLGKPLGFES